MKTTEKIKEKPTADIKKAKEADGHVYDDDGECEACGQSRECHPANIQTVQVPTPSAAEKTAREAAEECCKVTGIPAKQTIIFNAITRHCGQAVDNSELVTLDLWLERNPQWARQIPREVWEDLTFAFAAKHKTERQAVDNDWTQSEDDKLVVKDLSGNYISTAISDIAARLFIRAHNSASKGQDEDRQGEWRVERSKEGVSNPMARIMQGDQAVIGWTMRPFSESFDKIADAHNAIIAANDEQWRERFRKFEKIEEKFGPASQRSEEQAVDRQEWTPEALSRLFDAECSPEEAIKRICAKHEAELAAEQKEHGRIQANIALQVQELTRKLAAEREKYENAEREYQRIGKKYFDSQRQLAAERQRAEQAEQLYDAAENERQIVKSQLLSALAAIEKIRQLLRTKELTEAVNQILEVLKVADLSLLHQHDAELTEKVRKPLVDLLKTVRPYIDFRNEGARLIADKIDALAQCKQP